nr:putative disease resistance rpp13-like protein 1 [Quercus suber]
MAAELVGGAVLSALLQVAFDRVAPRDVVNFLKGSKRIDGLVQKLKIVLISANSVLNDAEEKQFTDSNVKQWLDELKDAVYVADDLLDEIATEALRPKLEAEFQTSNSKVWGFFSTSSNSFDKRIQSELEKILDRLEYIIKQKDALGLVASVAVKDALGLKGGFDESKKFEILYEAKGLRTFLGELNCSWQEYDNIRKMIGDLLKEFKTLRVLTFSSSIITELPNFVDNLKHLSYLNISDTEIKHLPNSLCNLYNLQTLILSPYITKLPTNMSKLVNLRHLDNSEANMEEMPPQMGKLKNLRKLPLFFVGQHDDGSSIRELGELRHLSGNLSIFNLEKVQCINKDTTGVILKNKEDLSKLELKWKPGHGTDDSEKERILLEQLCPCANLNSLTITNYEGTSFPKWLGDSSFSKMVSILLSNCENCFSLPPLGQLPDLKNLEIEYFGKITCVGHEFYGNMIKPFRALECLAFRKIPEWREWIIFEGEVFSALRELYIYYCPKLNGDLPVQLPSLTILDNRHFLPEFASLTHLKFYWCPILVSFPSGGLCAPNLSVIVIENCRNLKSLPEGMNTLLPSLVHLELNWCTELESFPEGGLPSHLESLLICGCDKLISRRMEWGLQGLYSLRRFAIHGQCKELESFPEESLLPPNLTNFYIRGLPYLKSLNGKGFQHLTSLKHLRLWECNNLDC